MMHHSMVQHYTIQFQMCYSKVTLAQLEDDLLAQLAAADPATILDNIPLIEGLEVTKSTSAEIQQQVTESARACIYYSS